MGKVLIVSFNREEEQDFEELILFLKEKGYGEFISMASTDNVLKYDGIEINPKYRTVREQGIEIELTNYEFEIMDLSHFRFYTLLDEVHPPVGYVLRDARTGIPLYAGELPV